MPISAAALPEEVSLCRGPVLASITSNLPTSGRPINALRLAVTGSPAVGQQLSFSYGGVSVVFTVQTVSDSSGVTISRQGALSLAQYAALLAVEIGSNAAVHEAFEVYATSGAEEYVYIAPRGSTEMEWAFEEDLDGIAIDNIQGTNAEYEPLPGVVLSLEIYQPATDTWADPIILVQPLTADGVPCVFDLSAYFSLRHHLPTSASIGSGGAVMQPCTDNWARYRLRYTDRAGLPAVTARLSTAAERYALYGAPGYWGQYSAWWHYWRLSGRFLSTAPTTREVYATEPWWLYWIGNTTTPTALRLRCIATRQSGATATYTYTTATISLGQVWAIKAGWAQLGLPWDPADPIISYQLFLINSGATEVSERITARIVGVYGQPLRYFAFGNPLGGIDTVRATGKWTSSLEVTDQAARRPITPALAAQGRGPDFSTDRKARALFEGSVGHVSAAYVAYLQELLLAPEAWLIDEPNLRFVPIVVDAGSVNLFKDGDDLFTLRFRYRHAWQDLSMGATDNGSRIILPQSPELERE